MPARTRRRLMDAGQLAMRQALATQVKTMVQARAGAQLGAPPLAERVERVLATTLASSGAPDSTRLALSLRCTAIRALGDSGHLALLEPLVTRAQHTHGLEHGARGAPHTKQPAQTPHAAVSAAAHAASSSHSASHSSLRSGLHPSSSSAFPGSTSPFSESESERAGDAAAGAMSFRETSTAALSSSDSASHDAGAVHATETVDVAAEAADGPDGRQLTSRACLSWVYATALHALATSGGADRLRRADALLRHMHALDVPPSAVCMMRYFGATRGVPTADHLGALRAHAAAAPVPLSLFNAMLEAHLPREGSTARETHALAHMPAVPVLLESLRTMDLVPNNRTLEMLYWIAQSPEETKKIHQLLPLRRPSALTHAMLTAEMRLSRRALLTSLLRQGRRSTPRPPPSIAMMLLRDCIRAGAIPAAVQLMQIFLSRGVKFSHRRMCALMLEAGEAAAQKKAGAVELLDVTRMVVFGVDERSRRQRGLAGRPSGLRSAAAEHEVVRALVVASWRAGQLSAAEAAAAAIERLDAVGVLPKRSLVTTIAYMHAASGDAAAAIDALRRPLAFAPAHAERAKQMVRTEGPYVAVLKTVRRDEDLPFALDVVRAMVDAGIPPSNLTRAAFCQIILRISETRRVGSIAPRSDSLFWREGSREDAQNGTRLNGRARQQEPRRASSQPDLLRSLRQHAPDSDAVDQVVLEAYAAAIFKRLAAIVGLRPQELGVKECARAKTVSEHHKQHRDDIAAVGATAASPQPQPQPQSLPCSSPSAHSAAHADAPPMGAAQQRAEQPAALRASG